MGAVSTPAAALMPITLNESVDAATAGPAAEHLTAQPQVGHLDAQMTKPRATQVETGTSQMESAEAEEAASPVVGSAPQEPSVEDDAVADVGPAADASVGVSEKGAQKKVRTGGRPREFFFFFSCLGHTHRGCNLFLICDAITHFFLGRIGRNTICSRLVDVLRSWLPIVVDVRCRYSRNRTP